jgi:hypothetical protein
MPSLRTLGTALLVPVLLSCDDRSNVPTDSQVSFDESNKAENLGSGSRFRPFGTGEAEMTRDPENGTNVVLRLEIGAGEFAGVVRDLRRVQVWQLDHQLNFHRAFVFPHTCGGGSPRMQVAIDSDGDGDFDFNGHGHVRPGLNNSFAGCETSTPTGAPDGPSVSTLVWRFEDLTDEQMRWEVTPATAVPPPFGPIGPAGGANTFTWDMFEAAIHGAFPNHRVLRVSLVEDATPGVTYYDLVTAFDLTLGTQGQWQPERRGQDD